MDLKSPAPIQSRLERLSAKGYVEWTKGKARTIRVLRQEPQGLPILGAIAAGGLVETFSDVREKLDLSSVFEKRNYFGLRVVGDSMIEDHITEGDVAIVRSLNPLEQLKNGEIVAARVEGLGTTLKHFYQHQDRVTLKAANPKYNPIEVMADTVQVQGVLVGVWRGYHPI